jgi:hypothetical protein
LSSQSAGRKLYEATLVEFTQKYAIDDKNNLFCPISRIVAVMSTAQPNQSAESLQPKAGG